MSKNQKWNGYDPRCSVSTPLEKFQPRHTCCIEDIPDYETGTYVIAELGDEEDRQEIRQEQAEQAEKLESLLLESEDKYRELGTPVVDFFDGYWHDRMKEIVQEQVRSNEDELQRIGVVLEEAGHASSCSDTEDATLEELGDEDE
ncbi:MAG: hypothetical protein M1830_005630 [Pleopsidium flavum]|nr:MAG: hypothetical protein M1830_005630 [Pleopsidium flavum]